ncbi:TraR/DksA family transcriptional regulator [Planctomyces sp. SH-PL62]|uniref:TraR/DksA family transcriptional regulator n=1 Tax=Planctomyces sp. SH-PL62 TaxID=1636152 RepID=UPI00078C9C5D|nr:TraR/DksA C4-type zinc finger protein [Planctomyces sp. SH-PL62]AMV38503.1 General stress protein 16O [Planctomyces sp. SH-PL62]
MAASLKPEEIESFRRLLVDLDDRLRGNVDRMTDEALRRNQNEASTNLSNVPLHMADVGTENYDQEFTLGLIENEQETLKLIGEALGRVRDGHYGRCLECEQPVARARLEALPYTRYCIECARKLENPE